MRGVGRFVVLVFGLSLALPQAASAAFAGSTVLVSRPTGLGPVPRAFDNDSQTPGALSSDGRYAVFESQADGFAPGAHPFVQNILLRDTQTNVTTLVSRSDGMNGAGVNMGAQDPAIAVAPNGHVLIAFLTRATNLVDHTTGMGVDPGGHLEVWLRDVTAETT